ncbi:MAG TPA: hypothetical protein VF677_08665 [Flavobacterium sp.]|jgi:hypothetical protein
MGDISLIITIISIVVHIIMKINDKINDNNNRNDHSYSGSDDNYINNYELSEHEKLANMNIDNLIVCYQSAAIVGFSFDKAHLMLLNNYVKNDMVIKDIIIRKNCMYLKIGYAMPFKDKDKCYSGSFSINYMLPNNSVSVYGFKKISADEGRVFQEIAAELIAVVS